MQSNKATQGSINNPSTQKSVRNAQNLAYKNNHNNNSRVMSARRALSKQVSFGGVEDNDSNQPLALTAKNLDLFNNMVLKTIRTAKFDER